MGGERSPNLNSRGRGGEEGRSQHMIDKIHLKWVHSQSCYSCHGASARGMGGGWRLFVVVTNTALCQTFEVSERAHAEGCNKTESTPTVSLVLWLSIWYCTRTNDVRGSHADRNAVAIIAASAVIDMSPCPFDDDVLPRQESQNGNLLSKQPLQPRAW